VDINASSDTGIAFYNPNATSITLTIRLLDAEGATIATTELTIAAHGHVARFATQFFPGQTSLRGSMAVTSAGGGVAAITLREDKIPLTYTTLPVVVGTSKNVNKPPSPLPLLDKTRTGLTITGNMTLDETLAEGKRLSGTINVSGIIYARADDGKSYSTFSLLPGPYLIIVPPGNYNLFECQFTGGVDSVLSLYHSEASPVQVTSDTTRDLNVPAPSTFGISGNVSGITGDLANSTLSVVFYDPDTTSVGTFGLSSGGAYQAQLPAGTWNVSLTATAQLTGGRSQYLGLYNLGSVTVGGGSTVANFTVPPTARLSGTVRIPGMASLPPTTLAVTDISAAQIANTTEVGCGIPSFGSSVQTESSGAYQIPLVSGRTYDIAAYAQIVANNPELGNVGFPVNLIRRDVAGDTSQDVNFPALPQLVTVTGRVTGPNGQAAAKAQININSADITGAPGASFSAVTTADSAGNYSVTVLSGSNYTVQFTPQPPLP